MVSQQVVAVLHAKIVLCNGQLTDILKEDLFVLDTHLMYTCGDHL